MSEKLRREEKARFAAHGHLSAANVFNFLLMIAVGIPPAAFVVSAPTLCADEIQAKLSVAKAQFDSTSLKHNNLDPLANSRLVHFERLPITHDNVVDIGAGERFRFPLPRSFPLTDSRFTSPDGSVAGYLCPLYAWSPAAYLLALLLPFLLLLFAVQAATDTTWLIDPYWTIGVWGLGAAALARTVHIASVVETEEDDSDVWLPRVVLQMFLLTLWSGRLTHSYFRRERFKFGVREDWRFEEQRAKFGTLYRFLFSLPHAYLSQLPLIAGLAAPVAVAARTGRTLWIATAWRRAAAGVGFFSLAEGFTAMDFLDTLSLALSLCGLAIAAAADAELREFVSLNEARAQRGERVVPVLDTGTWRYSRHPNYFGEQLFHWSLAFLSFPSWESLAGTLANSVVLAIVTGMTEQRMKSVGNRAREYREYARRTSVLVPWFPREPRGGRDECKVE